jgi:hypothetical protein
MKHLYELYCYEESKLLQFVAVLPLEHNLLLLDKALSKERHNLLEIKLLLKLLGVVTFVHFRLIQHIEMKGDVSIKEFVVTNKRYEP